MGLATPLAVMVGMGRGAEQGILFKSSEALQRVHAVTTVLLDKTGTITRGELAVTDVIPKASRDQILLLGSFWSSKVANIPSLMRLHPRGPGIIAEYRIPSDRTIESFRAIPGLGVEAVVSTHGMCCWVMTG